MGYFFISVDFRAHLLRDEIHVENIFLDYSRGEHESTLYSIREDQILKMEIFILVDFIANFFRE